MTPPNNHRPKLTAVSEEVAAGAGIDPLTVLTILMTLLPLLQECAGGPDQAAGWLRGDDLPWWGPLKGTRVRLRERLVRRKIQERTDNQLVEDRVVEKLRRATPLDMTLIYREAA